MAVAVTISVGNFARVATCSAAVAAFSGWPVIPYSVCSMRQLAGNAGLMLTAARNASMAIGALRSATWQCPRSWKSRLNRGWLFSSRSRAASASDNLLRYRKLTATM